jgi:TetR/AcrR family transcriptional regulator, cholesterol catabolism regulator
LIFSYLKNNFKIISGNLKPFYSFQSSDIRKIKNQLKARILEKSQELFFRYGIKAVTMDEIARELGISKKTIYQHFSDKDAIVNECVKAHFEQERHDSEKMQAEAPDPIAEVVMGSEMMRQMLTNMNPSMFLDLKRYYPTAWQMFIDFKNGFILNIIRQNLLKGIDSGLYRTDLNVEILARLRNEEVEMGFDPQVFPNNKFNVLETQLSLLDHFLRGIMTTEGLKLYEKYLATPSPPLVREAIANH